MPCQLQPENPPGAYDFVTRCGVQITVFADSDSGTVKLIAASLNGAPLLVDAEACATFRLVEGRVLLNLAFAGADVTEEFRIREGGGGAVQTLGCWRLQEGPAGEPGGPTREYQIYAKG